MNRWQRNRRPIRRHCFVPLLLLTGASESVVLCPGENFSSNVPLSDCLSNGPHSVACWQAKGRQGGPNVNKRKQGQRRARRVSTCQIVPGSQSATTEQYCRLVGVQTAAFLCCRLNDAPQLSLFQSVCIDTSGPSQWVLMAAVDATAPAGQPGETSSAGPQQTTINRAGAHQSALPPADDIPHACA